MEVWLAIILYCVGLALVVAEVFLPGVILGLIGTATLVVSIYFGFTYSIVLGIAQIIIAVIFVPSAFIMGVKRLALKKSLETKEGVISFAKDYSHLLGKEGVAISPLRPAGTVLIDKKKFDVVTEGELIEKGSRIKVLRIEGSKIIVRTVDEKE